ncbi:M56 family metallopeptidase [Sphingobacterium lactis]|uniref:M56 family metallopeptidase n=1 Tax=Sphingobacterium lactis TaxID=797291 RepID=UPI003EC55DBF
METTAIHIGTALGWGIIHSIWQAAIWYIIYCLLNVALKNRSAATKHNLAFAMQVGIMVSFLATFCYFFERLIQEPSFHGFENGIAANQLIQLEQNPLQIERFIPYIVLIYVIGMFFQIGLLIQSILKMRQIRFKGLEGISLEWSELFRTARQKLNIPEGVQLFLSTKIDVPLTLGHLKPFVLFPIAYANKMDINQVEAILLHELAHVKRRDYLINLIKVCIETLMFFNPFVWALSKVIEREREHACDDLVLQHITKPITYAQALVELEELRMAMRPKLAMAATGKRNHLLKRIKRITKMETNYKNVKPQLAALLLSGAALVGLSFIIPGTDTYDQTSTSLENSQVVSTGTSTDSMTVAPIPVQHPAAPKNQQLAIPAAPAPLANQDTTVLPAEVKATIKNVQAEAEKIQAYYQSPEWKAKIAEIEKNAAKVQEQFTSAEWKAKVEAMEKSGKDVSAYFESDEWKKQMASIEKETAKIQEHFDSPEWKEKMAKITEETKKVTAYFESPEWKEKVKKWSDMHDDPEFKKINEKYHQEVQNLMHKKSKAQ